MRLFVFLLMLAIAAGGSLGGYKLITGKDLVTLKELPFSRIAANAEPIPTATPTVAPTVVPTVVPSIPTAIPTPTPAPPEQAVMVVANTDGLGVYLRNSPNLNDRVRAWVEGTRMEVIGPEVEGDGTQWLKVRSPDGTEGYIPVRYLSPVP